MCVLAYIKSDSYITKEEFFAMFDANPHGGGMAYKLGDKIHIEKGFFNCDKFWEAYNNVKQTLNVDIAIHFRIATSGQITSQFCHPYTLTNNINDMYRLSTDADTVVFHNGVLNISVDDGCNDTMTFIKNRLYPLYKEDKNFLNDKHNWINISNDISGSRLLVMQCDNVFMLGNGWTEYRNGMYVSNRNWIYKLKTKNENKNHNYNYNCGYWDESDEEDYFTDSYYFKRQMQKHKKQNGKRYKSYIDFLEEGIV